MRKGGHVTESFTAEESGVVSGAPEFELREQLIGALTDWLRTVSSTVLLPEIETALAQIAAVAGAEQWHVTEHGEVLPAARPPGTLHAPFHTPDGRVGEVAMVGAEGTSGDADRLLVVRLVAALVTQVLARAEPELSWERAMEQDESIFDRAPVPLFVVDDLGFIVKANEKTTELVGLRLDQVLGEHVGRFIHPEDYDGQADHWVRMQVDPGFDAVSSEIRLLTSRGVSWQRVALRAMRDDAGVLTHIAVHLADINEKYAAEAALDRSRRQFGDLLDSLPDPIVRVNRRFEVEFSNPAAIAARGPGPLAEWPQVSSADRRRVQRAMRGVLATGVATTVEHSVDDGPATNWVETTIVGERSADGTVKSLLLVCRDITDRRRHEAELAHQANHDTLTGLPNRGRFAELLHIATRRQRAHHDGGRERPLAVLFFDLDRFKVVNDSLGHAAGDQLLEQVAERLAGALRPDDVLGRLGGDEFTVLAHDIARDDAIELAERLQEQLRTPFELDGREFLMTASVGIVTSSRPEDPADLMRWADAAMYRAKQQGRNCTATFDDVLRDEAIEQLELDQMLRTALEHHEFEVHFQPEVCLRSGDIVGAEALVRWRHPTRGLLAAGEFVELAEENGTIVPIGRWVMATACSQVAEWRRRRLVDPGFVLRVNLSARQLELPALVGEVRDLLTATEFPAEQFCLEITETALMRDVDHALVVLTELHGLGIRLAVDDFGTGYSSLSSLKRFPLQVLKIDRSFIDGLPADAHDLAIATTVLRLAENLDLTTIAEGVETEEQRVLLRDLGCPTAQGYLFSRPLPVEEFTALLARADG
jgi:diguanylate cyclase (GGDEF)-like protein/PAS domain S-box-containing protein